MAPKTVLVLSVALLLSSCAQKKIARGTPPRELVRETCSIGRSVKKVAGSVRIHADLNEMAGVFPADLLVKDEESRLDLDLEVSNPFGGTEARLKIRGSQYQISVPGNPDQNQQGSGQWKGIPLKWAATLFLGRIPCPTSRQLRSEQTRLSNDDGELKIEMRSPSGKLKQSFLFEYQSMDNRPWPRKLIWTRGEGDLQKEVEFLFAFPDAKTRSPKRWEARSDQGMVQVNWTDREIL